MSTVRYGVITSKSARRTIAYLNYKLTGEGRQSEDVEKWHSQNSNRLWGEHALQSRTLLKDIGNDIPMTEPNSLHQTGSTRAKADEGQLLSSLFCSKLLGSKIQGALFNCMGNMERSVLIQVCPGSFFVSPYQNLGRVV